jgi:phosphatidylinositol kinase/protein kinase (PI-3  family)
MDRTVGLIEWCTGTTSLNDYLVGPNKSGGSHLRLRPNDMHVGQAMRQLANTRSNGSDALYTTFMDICNNVSPVFRYFFYESYVQPHNFVKHVQFYTDSLALWSIGRNDF